MTLGIWILAAASCVLALWQTFQSQASNSWKQTAGLVAIAAAFVLTVHPAETAPTATTPDEWSHAATSLFLLAGGLWWMVSPHREHSLALRMLALCGGALATSSTTLPNIWVGLTLYGVASQFAVGRRPSPRYLLGNAIMLFGIAMTHMGTGSADITHIGRSLWMLAGPLARTHYAAGALIVGGVILITAMVFPDMAASGEDAPAVLLGNLVLARYCMVGLGAIWWEWSRVLLVVGLLAILWGWERSRRTKGSIARFERLAIAQRGFLLVYLALTAHPDMLSAWLTGLAVYVLSQMGLMSTLRALAPHEAPDPLAGLVRRQPLAGLPILVLLASLAALPPTMGFFARFQALATIYGAGAYWLVIMLLLGTAINSAGYTMGILQATLSTSEPDAVIKLHPAQWAVLALTALGALLLGLLPFVGPLATRLIVP